MICKSPVLVRLEVGRRSVCTPRLRQLNLARYQTGQIHLLLWRGELAAVGTIPFLRSWKTNFCVCRLIPSFFPLCFFPWLAKGSSAMETF